MYRGPIEAGSLLYIRAVNVHAGEARGLIGFLLGFRNGSDGFGILQRIVDEGHVLIFRVHPGRTFVVAFMRFVFHGLSLLSSRSLCAVCEDVIRFGRLVGD